MAARAGAFGRLGVQSRSEVGWIVSELPRLVCPSFADVLVGSEPPQGLEALSEVVGVEERCEVLLELVMGFVVIAPDGGFLEGAVHPFDLTVGPWMVRFGETMLDPMLAADAVEHVQPVAGRRAGSRKAVAELDAVIGQDSVYPVGNSLDQRRRKSTAVFTLAVG